MSFICGWTRALNTIVRSEGYDMRVYEFWWRFRKNRAAEISSYCILLFIVVAMCASWISPYDPFALGNEPFLPPQRDHLMGTDDLGRDTFSRVMYGTQVSLMVGFLAAATS